MSIDDTNVRPIHAGSTDVPPVEHVSWCTDHVSTSPDAVDCRAAEQHVRPAAPASDPVDVEVVAARLSNLPLPSSSTWRTAPPAVVLTVSGGDYDGAGVAELDAAEARELARYLLAAADVIDGDIVRQEHRAS